MRAPRQSASVSTSWARDSEKMRPLKPLTNCWVDEALSVGDAYFQHKCMRRIKTLIDQGTTLLFVSHDSGTVKRFCSRGLWLDQGQQRFFGEAGVAIEYGPVEEPWGVRRFFVRDPVGTLVNVLMHL